MYDCWAYDPKERPDFRTIARTIEQVLGTWRSLHAPPPHLVLPFQFVSYLQDFVLFLRSSFCFVLVQTRTRRTTTSCPTRGSPSRARTRRGKARPSPRHRHDDPRRRASSDGFGPSAKACSNQPLPPSLPFSTSSFLELSGGVFEVRAGHCFAPGADVRRVRDVHVQINSNDIPLLPHTFHY
jgi:hypothetical protein